jgi:chloride channel 7
MLVLLISKTIGDLFNHSVYEQILHIKGLPFLEEKPEPYMKQLTVLDVCSWPARTLSTCERVSTIVDTLKSTDHNGFPVLEHSEEMPGHPVLYGLILRSHLLVLLRRGEFSRSRYRAVDFAKRAPGKGDRIEDIDLSSEQLEMYVDLRPYTNRSPYTVADSMSLAKAFLLFRQLGLRHLCVVPTSPTEVHNTQFFHANLSITVNFLLPVFFQRVHAAIFSCQSIFYLLLILASSFFNGLYAIIFCFAMLFFLSILQSWGC